MSTKQELDQLAVNTIRFLAVDAIDKANSGHPGMPLGAAPIVYTLWDRFMRHNPADPQWPNRDRFILSAGHASAMLYALLYLTGYPLSLDDLRAFRQFGSKTPGHPEYAPALGIETTTGPLGQGLANGVGMAMAEAHLAARFNRPGYEIVDHYTYVLASDGEMMEGISHEAASLAGHLRLGKLIVFYDSNGISIDGQTSITFNDDTAARFAAYGWQVLVVPDGNDIDGIAGTITAAQEETTKPSLIIVDTHIGYGSPKQDSASVHGSPLGPDATRQTKENLGWPLEPAFFVPDEVLTRMRQAVERGAVQQSAWQKRFAAWAAAYPALAQAWQAGQSGVLPAVWHDILPHFAPTEKPLATRKASGKSINALAAAIPYLVGGSADLAPSNNTYMTGKGDFQPEDYSGRNIHFGVREHVMGAAMNGIALHGGLRVFGGTFLVFSDYMRPTIRLAAMMHLPVIYVFTHDSIGLGEDGPTHQPVEHLPALRAIPNLWVVRPADANETVVAWRLAMERQDGPVALILSRQSLPILDVPLSVVEEGVARGAYVLLDSAAAPNLLLLATGSEVSLAVQAARRLAAEGIAVRVVSAPNLSVFADQPQTYRDAVLPPQLTARLAVEAAVPLGWRRWVGDRGDVIGLDRYGASGPGEIVMAELGFNVENVVRRAKALLAKT